MCSKLRSSWGQSIATMKPGHEQPDWTGLVLTVTGIFLITLGAIANELGGYTWNQNPEDSLEFCVWVAEKVDRPAAYLIVVVTFGVVFAMSGLAHILIKALKRGAVVV